MIDKKILILKFYFYSEFVVLWGVVFGGGKYNIGFGSVCEFSFFIRFDWIWIDFLLIYIIEYL